MIAGAFYGLDAIPVRWLKKLNREVRAEVEDQALGLVGLSPWGQRQA
jgi:ADP-ribosyl-[dinitrogen reductase] hydrolase